MTDTTEMQALSNIANADLLAIAMKLPEVAELVNTAAFLLWAQDNKALDVRDCTETWASLRTTLAPFTAARKTT